MLAKFRLLTAALLCSQLLHAAPSDQTIISAEWHYEVIEKLPHHERPFTQGLEIHGNHVFESSGLYGNSYIARWSLDNKQPFIKKALSHRLFAEGLTLINNKGYLLTWQNQRGYIFDPATLRITGSFSYRGEGWGLTNDGRSLIMSNGSNELIWLSTKDFAVQKKVQVTLNGQPVKNLNELEWMNGKILANIWQTFTIAVIDPATGNVLATLNLQDLMSGEAGNTAADVLNGIAYDKRNNTLLVTGKKWQWVYRIRLTEKTKSAT